MIYSSELIPRAIQMLFLRSTRDPTNSPNAAPRSTHDLRQTATNALGIDTRSHYELGMLWYHLLRALVQQPMRNLPTGDRCSRRSTQHVKNREIIEKNNQHSI